jgi:hypothetical protein
MRISNSPLLVCIALLLARPVCAQAPYDGSYVGYLANFSASLSNSSQGCMTFDAPPPVMISDGHAQVSWNDKTLKGDVTEDGALILIMRTGRSEKFVGQIDANGFLRGQYSGPCAYSLAWERKH